MNRALSYWERRKAREMYKMTARIEDVADELTKLYVLASMEIEEDARRLSRRFQLRHKLTERDADILLSKIIDKREINTLIRELKKNPKNSALAAELESQAYAARIKRLSAVQASVDTITGNILTQCGTTFGTTLMEIAKGAYYREIFGLQQRANAAFTFSALDATRIQEILGRNWSGASYSSRLWANTTQLSESVKREILLGLLTGKSQSKMTRAIRNEFHSGATATRRLIRTEGNYVANQVAAQAYTDTGVEKYIYTAVLDLRTSAICRSLDRKEFPISEQEVGVNYPPMHPWCRSGTIPWVPEELITRLKRSAIDPVTGERVKIPANMNYEDWYNKYVRGKEDQIELQKGEWLEKNDIRNNYGLASSGEYANAIPSHDPPEMVGTIDISDEEKIGQIFDEYEEIIRTSPIENAIVITKDGEVYHCYGQLNGVWPNIDLGDKLYGAYVLHNHPVGSLNEYSFSKEDINLFEKYKLNFLGGIDDKYRYMLDRSSTIIDSEPTIGEALKTDYGELQRHAEVIREISRFNIGYHRERI